MTLINPSPQLFPQTVKLADSKRPPCELTDEVFDIIRSIRDPEHPHSLEELNVVQEELVTVDRTHKTPWITIEFVPTVPHCTLATLIGLCIRTKVDREFRHRNSKIDIFIKEGTHTTKKEIDKQVNDKERVAAALENEQLMRMVESCIKEVEM